MRTLLAVLLATFVACGCERASMADMNLAASAPAADTVARKKAACEEQWRKYRASQECFAPYRLTNGGIKAEAFKHCTEMKQPEFCD